jgi:hypothetical protein
MRLAPPLLAALLASGTACAFGGSGASPPGGAATGAACQGGPDCKSGTCIVATDAGWPGGYCSQMCASAACPEGSACEVFSDGHTTFELCLVLCDGGCRGGYSCAPRADGGPAVCSFP